jgi:hypothetical protein
MARRNSTRLLIQNLIGQQFGRITVLALASPEPDGRVRRLICQCECGTLKSIRRDKLTRTRSCGCARPWIKHGQRRNGTTTRTYRIWQHMLERCLNPHDGGFPHYGGRGIAVCERWHTFAHFFADMGACPEGLTIERIDNDQGYFPGNCRWATRHEQANNTRRTRYLTLHGVRQTMTAWSQETGWKVKTIESRLRRGLTEEEALTRPLARPRGPSWGHGSPDLFEKEHDATEYGEA